MDCLDAFILGAAMDVMQLGNVDERPGKWKPPPLLEHLSKKEQFDWLTTLAENILQKHIKLDEGKRRLMQ